MSGSGSIGFWVLEGLGLLILAFTVVGQTGALIDYELMVSLGLQEPASVVTALGVVLNRAYAAADTFVYVPLLAIGLIGYWLEKNWGAIALAAAMGITAYWPVFSLVALYGAVGVPGFNFASHATYTVILVPIAVFGLWGLFFLSRHGRYAC